MAEHHVVAMVSIHFGLSVTLYWY